MDLTVQALIIGGGATGTAIARDLAMRGVSTCLLERGDLASGTTGNYHGLLHSGARYVTDDPGTARACAEEGAILRRIAPHCIDDTGGLFLVLDGRAEILFQPPFLAGCAAAGIPVEELDHATTLREEPLVAPNTIRAFRVPDATLDAWRLCVANVLSAQDHGTWAFRGVTIGALLREGDRIVGATGRNSITAQYYTIHAEYVINACGPWAGRLAALAGPEIDPGVAPNKGTMVAMAQRPVTHVINYCRPPADGDIIVPNGTGVVLGTTTSPTADPDDTGVPAGEPERLIAEAIKMVPVLREVATVRSWAAVRPLVAGEERAGQVDQQGRARGRDWIIIDHEERDSLGGFVTVIGGKVTTARRMAEEVSDLICDKLGVDAPCRTAVEPLPGAEARRLRQGG
ncbi:MAG: Anaerobic glycerol-3-phosphate dehydrogenase subunit A [uncultured Thermomicrobiales bacterium]|uniref:Anaerobic glycerol-3-phosphate dehydrogenase subunit A n=1 Tax=uncultured Thermomicrobiales bacterium TaxID=1645740 RepID=A0A6J4UYJ3_9BACT|nr:MAG: Anaerobic glycerol-3-phosphate dehydrogenase subunit A [uncultured Thermomicrobiales bacterium]